MESQREDDLKIEIVRLRIALQSAREKIFEYQEGKEEIDGSLVGALYWIERGLHRDVDHSIRLHPDLHD